MFPFIQNEDEARRAVSFTRYPPDGVRGVAAVHRASRHGTVANYHRQAASELCVVVQIETIAALERIKTDFRAALQPLKPGAPLPY